METGLLKIAMARGTPALPLLQLFPSLLLDPLATAAALPARHRRRSPAPTPDSPIAAAGNDGDALTSAVAAATVTPLAEPDAAAVVPYLVTFRSRLLAATAAGAPAEADGTAAAVDFALLRAWLHAGDYGALLALLRQRNAISLADGCHALRRAGAYREAVRALATASAPRTLNGSAYLCNG